MSVKSNYENLLLEQKSTEKRLNEAELHLKRLQEKHSKLTLKAGELKSKTSPAAKNVLDKTNKELADCNANLKKYTSLVSSLASALADIDAKVITYENTPFSYIEEQAKRMLKTFMSFVSQNESQLAINITTDFLIKEKTSHVHHRYGDYFTPTGNVCICIIGCVGGTKEVAESEDFYFKQTLYTREYGPYDNIYVHYTDWFKEYLDHFYETLKVLIITEFESNANFKVTFDDSQNFTLELI